MRRRPRAIPGVLPLLLSVFVLFSGCKGTEEYIEDLYACHDPDGSLNLAIYDAGQLVHEAFAGIHRQEALTWSQLARTLSVAARIAEKNEVPMLRAQALALGASLTLRVPLPPVREPLRDDPGFSDTVFEQSEALTRAVAVLEAGTDLIPRLSSPDAAEVERAYARLKQVTGEDLARDAAAWESWWAENRERLRREAAAGAQEPMGVLGGLRYPRVGTARAVLGIIGNMLAVQDIPSLRPAARRAVRNIGRQVVELSVVRALRRDPSALVRGEAALAAARIRAPDFGEPLVQALRLEPDSGARVRMVRALAWYPGRTMLETMVELQADESRSVRINARELLVRFTRRDFGSDAGAWIRWWEESGRKHWP